MVEQISSGVFRRHLDWHLPEQGEAWVLVDKAPEFRVHIQQVELTGAPGEGLGDAVHNAREYFC